MQNILFDAVPVLYACDVAVIGGGTAGCAAAICAAREGKRVALIERGGSVGGVPVLSSMGSFGNRYSTDNGELILRGFPLELLEALIAMGATASDTLEGSLVGTMRMAFNIPVQPEAVAHALLLMLRDAGVRVFAHSMFVAPQMRGERIESVVIATKEGLRRIEAQVFIDCTGEADVAYTAGAPCVRDDFTWGVLMRLGNVDFERVLAYMDQLNDYGEDEDFNHWLRETLQMTDGELRAHRHWRHLYGPLQNTHTPLEGTDHNREKIDWLLERYQKDGFFYNIEMPLLRRLLRKAVEAGDLALIKRFPGFGSLWVGFDGFAGGAWGDGISLMNVTSAAEGMDPTKAEHVSLVETEGRIYCNEIAAFFKKYVPGFERSMLLDIGAQFTSRSSRAIEGDCPLTKENQAEILGAYPGEAIYRWKVSLSGKSLLAGVPYRVLLPKGVDNLLVAGKCAWGGIHYRSIASCLAMGQAAGVAAALGAELCVKQKDVPIARLQGNLRAQGVMI